MIRRLLLALSLGLFVGGFGLLAVDAAWAQFPGMTQEEEAQPPAPPAAPDADATPEPAPPDSLNPTVQARYYWNRYMGEGSPYRGLALMIVTLLVLTILYRQSTKYMERFLQREAFSQDNARTFLKTWRSIWKFVIAVFTLLALSGSLRLLGLSAGFLGMMLGWSLQAPVTGIAAWLMIITKKPFRIGDRIVLAGYTGDVTGITLTHVILNQVGGSVGGEERSGRGILIPNGLLFSHVVINYTFDQKYMLDEVLVRLTFDSDYDLAERLCLQAVRAVTPEIIKDSKFEPNVRCELYDSGVLLRVRYQTVPSDRQRISTDVTRRILDAIKGHYDAVKFCFPHSVVRYRRVDDGDDGSNGQAELPPLERKPQPQGMN